MDVFTWSRFEIGLALVLATLIVIGGTGHLLLAHKQGPRPIIVEARGGAGLAANNTNLSDTDATVVRAPSVVTEGNASDSGSSEQRSHNDTSQTIDEQATDEQQETEDRPAIGPDWSEGPSRSTVYDLININKAQASELQRLPGIGPALAARIIAYREAWGPFDTIEDILEVSGIGPVKFANMKHMLTVD